MSAIRLRASRAGAPMPEGATPDAMAQGRRRARAGVLEPGIALPAAAHLLFRLVEQT